MSWRPCHAFQARARTSCFCVACSRHLCLSCLGRSLPTITCLVVCPACEASEARAVFRQAGLTTASQLSSLTVYSAATAHILSQGICGTTLATYQTGVSKFVQFAAGMGVSQPLPSPPGLVTAFLTHCVVVLGLDSSTTALYLTALSSWHEHAKSLPGMSSIINPLQTYQVRLLIATIQKHYKKPSSAKRALQPTEVKDIAKVFPDDRRGRHHKLCFLLAIFCCMRQKAATRLRVIYKTMPTSEEPNIVFLPGSDIDWGYCNTCHRHFISVKVVEDKNHSSLTGPQISYLPLQIPALDVNPGLILAEYLVHAQPPSGGYLLAAPLGADKWSASAFTNMAGVFKNGLPGPTLTDQLIPASQATAGVRRLHKCCMTQVLLTHSLQIVGAGL